MLGRFSFPVLGLVAFALVLILFGVCTTLDGNSILKLEGENGTKRVIIPAGANPMMGSYGMMMDATAMCVMGFGFLYAFCRKYSWGGIVFNFLMCGLCFLWCQVCTCIVHVIFSGHFQKTEINLAAMISADLVTAAVLITFGVVYGFVSPCQILVICLIEPLAMKINEHIVIDFLGTSDAGGSILTHAFGAFYGVGLNLGLGIKPKYIPEENRKTNKFGDTFALVGTIVLWMFWPSFNGSLLYDDASVQHRVVVNTYLAICASCVTAMIASHLVHGGKLNILEVQNATLAGGVSIGMSCSYNVNPWVPVLIGGLAGMLSSVGYGKIAEFLENLGMMDSAGAVQLHGIPGVFGAVAAGIVVIATTNNQYFAADTVWTEMDGNTNGKQFGMILLSVLVTIAISFVVGALNGLLVRVPICEKVESHLLIDETPYFEIELEDEPMEGNEIMMKEQ
ncbi:hypothetical protein ACHWQZ_G004497 [Mnemiopsis leidyi]